MLAPNQSSVRNRILSLMPPEDYEIIRKHLVYTIFKSGEPLAFPNTTCQRFHFLESGLASQIAVTPGNKKLEVGLYGRDGVGPVSNILGVDQSPHQLIIQMPGDGYLIDAQDFAAIAGQSPALRALLLRYIQAFTVQTGYTALSNGSGVIGERLARWLLMCLDRVDGPELPLTHEFLGIMLGVRRSGVTDAIHLLEGGKIVQARRGLIRVLDRDRLEATAGESYGVPEAEYRRLVGAMS